MIYIYLHIYIHNVYCTYINMWVSESVQCSSFFASGCDEFTVDSCSPDPSQMINTVSIPNNGEQTEICQDLCDKQADCAYWSIFCPPNQAEPCPCTFYESSYLHSCQEVGGDKDTDIEVIL